MSSIPGIYRLPLALRRHFGPEGQDVFDFHAKFFVPMASAPSLLDPMTAGFRIKFMQEELDEFIEGCNEGNLLKAGDALVDLVYVALGTALFMGLPWRSLWERVHGKNMQKRKAKDDGSDSKRGSPLDIIKPEGWTPPDHTPDLGPGMWMTFDATHLNQLIGDYLKEHAVTGNVFQQGQVSSASVRVDADGSKHHTSVAEPIKFQTQVGKT